ncbi:MAG: hypothetical protein K0R29_2515 [Pseudobdellovibrio sp.]|jgi:hypothetical protein|nr:hypothetical protein [Pseudobdellovibrio sp.]
MKTLLTAVPVLLLSLTSVAAKMMVVTPQERATIMKSAKVWEHVNIAERDLLNGPSRDFALFQKVENCKFYDGFYTKVGNSGKTAKFWCLPEGGQPGKDEIKVKYSQSNGEVFAEVVSSRLLWSLGFFSDRALPISVSCVNCPEDPWKYLNYMAFYQGAPSSIRPIGGSSVNKKAEQKNDAAVYLENAQKKRTQLDAQSLKTTGQRYARQYAVALSEEKYKGTAVTVPGDSKAGVGLDELSQISETEGGSTKAEIDALRLLVAFIKHGDNKAANHRLVCPEEHLFEVNGKPSCKHASVVLQDVGATMGDGTFTLPILNISFGPTGNSKLSYDGWRKTPVWKNKANCQALLGDNLVGGTMKNPTVSEAGRKFLADLLVQLSDQQLTDMFTAARVDKREGVRAASVQEWVDLFKSKRNEIVTAQCPR